MPIWIFALSIERDPAEIEGTRKTYRTQIPFFWNSYVYCTNLKLMCALTVKVNDWRRGGDLTVSPIEYPNCCIGRW